MMHRLATILNGEELRPGREVVQHHPVRRPDAAANWPLRQSDTQPLWQMAARQARSRLTIPRRVDVHQVRCAPALQYRRRCPQVIVAMDALDMPNSRE